MPKTAAAVLGFALVTGSIGLNTARYPAVWRMVGPADQAVLTSEAIPSASSPATSADRPPPAALAKTSAPAAVVPMETKPVSPSSQAPAVAAKKEEPPAAEAELEARAAVSGAPPAGPADMLKAEPSPAAAPVTTVAQTKPSEPHTTNILPTDAQPAASKPEDAARDASKPLVPVVAPANDKQAANPAAATEVRRLPPVERGMPGHGDGDLSRLFSGTVPAYTATNTP